MSISEMKTKYTPSRALYLAELFEDGVDRHLKLSSFLSISVLNLDFGQPLLKVQSHVLSPAVM